MAEVKLIGVDVMIRNLNREIKKIENQTESGLIKAGLIVQRSAQEKVPVNTGNLKASAYTKKLPLMARHRPVVEIGFTASYAPFVHEALGVLRTPRKPRPKKRGYYWDPLGKAEPQFLRNALTGNATKILSIIKQEARIRR